MPDRPLKALSEEGKSVGEFGGIGGIRIASRLFRLYFFHANLPGQTTMAIRLSRYR